MTYKPVVDKHVIDCYQMAKLFGDLQGGRFTRILEDASEKLQEKPHRKSVEVTQRESVEMIKAFVGNMKWNLSGAKDEDVKRLGKDLATLFEVLVTFQDKYKTASLLPRYDASGLFLKEEVKCFMPGERLALSVSPGIYLAKEAPNQIPLNSSQVLAAGNYAHEQMHANSYYYQRDDQERYRHVDDIAIDEGFAYLVQAVTEAKGNQNLFFDQYENPKIQKFYFMERLWMNDGAKFGLFFHYIHSGYPCAYGTLLKAWLKGDPEIGWTTLIDELNMIFKKTSREYIQDKLHYTWIYRSASEERKMFWDNIPEFDDIIKRRIVDRNELRCLHTMA
nr:hypothetical protein [Candidatus Sigynarchaeota archaeon]